MAALTLAAEDAEDLAVMSAALQDAVALVGDLVWLPKSQRFAGVFNRFKWEETGDRRVRARLHFDRVLSARSRHVRLDERDAVVCLLAIRFEPAPASDPSGIVELVLAGGGTIRLEVECIDAGLADLGDAWPARARPNHDSD